jgi:hypothetical protein
MGREIRVLSIGQTKESYTHTQNCVPFLVVYYAFLDNISFDSHKNLMKQIGKYEYYLLISYSISF